MSTKNDQKKSSIGERIKAYRVRNKLTLVQLANLIGISHGSLSGLENDKSKPSAETLSNFCLHTDIDIEWLLTGEGPNKLGKPPKSRKFELLNEFEDWLDEEVRMDPKRKDWFELQLLDSFSAFREWKQKRAKEEGGGSEFPASKAA